MEYLYLLFEICKMLSKVLPVLFVVFFALFIPKKKNYKYNKLDIAGIFTNVILSVLYVPMSIMGLFSIFLGDAPTDNYSFLTKILLGISLFTGISIPGVSILSIIASVVTRKQGKSKLSFIIQFLPILVFGIMLLSMALFSKK